MSLAGTPTENTRASPSRVWRILTGVASVGAVPVALVWVVSRNSQDWSMLWRTPDFRFLAAALLAHAIALLIAAYAWHRMTVVIASERNIARNVHAYVTTAFARRLPGSLWGPGLRMYWYRRLGGDWRGVGVASVAEAWAITVAGGLLALLGAVSVIGSAADARVWLGLGCVLVVLVLLSSRPGRSFIRRRLPRIIPSTLSASPGTAIAPELVRWVGLEAVTWLFGGLELAAITRALTPYPPDLIPAVLASWATAGTLGALITFVPGGFGLVELSLAGLLQLKFPLTIALAAALGMRLVTMLDEAIWMVGGAIPVVWALATAKRKRVP